MYATKPLTLTLLALASLTLTLTLAAPAPAPQTSNDQTVNDSVNLDQANQQCGNDQALSCCNNEGSDGGLIGGILDGLLGGACGQVPVSLLGLGLPLSDACGDNVAACCQGDQTGLLNVQCVPISIL